MHTDTFLKMSDQKSTLLEPKDNGPGENDQVRDRTEHKANPGTEREVRKGREKEYLRLIVFIVNHSIQ